MRINYCHGYYKEGGFYFYHDEESGLDYQVCEDEALAHRPEMFFAEQDCANRPVPSDEEVMEYCKTYNSYQDAIIKMEEVVKSLEEAGNLDGVGAVYDVVIWMKNQQTQELKKLGIIF